MNEERYVVALEISSSKIIGAVGKPNAQGRLDVIAVEQEKCIECVRRGFVQNIEETALRIGRIIDRLERKPAISPKKIKGVYIGLSARSMRSIAAQTSLKLAEETIINDEILRRVADQARQMPIDSSLDIIDAVPRRFEINKNVTMSPIGTFGDSISATYDLIVSRPELKKNIQRTMVEKVGKEITGYVVTALAAGHLILTDDEKRLGCLLADIGAETTTITIYKNGSLYYYATIPIGSRNITLDITSLNVLEERAEEIKISSGNAMPLDTPNSLNVNGIKYSDVSNLVVARAEEIVANILAQIEYAGLKYDDLPGGIILIGGGAKLNGMIDLIKSQSFLSVKRGEFPSYINIEDSKVPTSEIIEVVSVLYAGATLGTESCLEMPRTADLPHIGEANIDEEQEEEEKKKKEDERGPKKPSWTDRAKTIFSNFFKAEDDDNELE